jgi:glycosyltransferase involved in cell wall biosynthesis
MNIAFCHHLSLSYFGGGEKWLVNTAKELVRRGHNVEIYALPFLLEGKRKVKPKELLEDIPYSEGLRHKVKADVVYVTYNPLSWMFFQTSKPRIGGIHAQSYWQKPDLRYGLLPNVSLMANKMLSYFELRHFNAVHMVTGTYPCNHPKVFMIPNFVDASFYKPTVEKPDEFTVSFSSRTVWQKGWDIFQLVTKFLQKFSTLSARRFPHRLSFKVAAGKVKEHDMPDFLSASHLSFLPSRVDTFGLALVESALCETPVLTTPLDTHKYLGLPLAYGESVSDFLRQIRRFCNEWETGDEYGYLREWSRDSRVKALKYDKTVVMNQIERMFKEVIEGCTYGK